MRVTDGRSKQRNHLRVLRSYNTIFIWTKCYIAVLVSYFFFFIEMLEDYSDTSPDENFAEAPYARIANDENFVFRT